MEEFVPYDPDAHRVDLVQLNIEYMTWVFNQLDEQYQLDSLSMLGQTVPEIVDASIEPFLGFVCVRRFYPHFTVESASEWL